MPTKDEMQHVREALESLQNPTTAPSAPGPSSYDPAAVFEAAKAKAARYNSERGTLQGYDCPVCLNRGLIMEIDERGYEIMRFCACRKVRNSMKLIDQSGLRRTIDYNTFGAFKTNEPWQGKFKATAMDYAKHVREGGGAWFFAGGQPGSGKTHLCTAICGGLLRDGIPVRYVIWPDTVDRLKAVRFDDEAAQGMLDPLKTVAVLYIDDLFKGAKIADGHPSPTDADLRLCFEVLNFRYAAGLPTIISCEWTLEQLSYTDEALFSRVFEKSEGFQISIGRDRAKNIRLRGGNAK